MKQAKDYTYLRTRRTQCVQLRINGETASLRDQKPLKPRRLDLQGGWTLEDFLESLNRRVFFWPGKALAPIPHGERHFRTYEQDKPTVLRIRVLDMLATNSNVEPLFCRYNSGSSPLYPPPSPRGPETFLDHEGFTRAQLTPCCVKEVTFCDGVALPPSTQYRRLSAKTWQAFF